jgi:lysozyme family protein
MIGNYQRSELLVLSDEGAKFTNNPKDRGGPTKLGVTQRALSDWLGHPATVDEVKALTPATVAPIYEAHYWTAVRGNEVPSGVDYFLFDAAVQHGRGRAVKFLQQTIDLPADGAFGPLTLRRLAGVNDIGGLIEGMRVHRSDFYRHLDDFPTWGKGWINRLTRVSSTAKAWARKAA